MPKFETFPDRPFFKIDNTPYQKGLFNITYDGDKVGIDYENGRAVVNPLPFNQWTDLNDNPFPDLQTLRNEIESGVFF